MNYKVCDDVLISYSKGHPVVSNVRTKEHMLLDPKGIFTLTRYYDGADKQTWESSLQEAYGQDVTLDYFGENGLHDDPTFIDLSKIKSEPKISGAELLLKLLNHHILIGDPKEYEKFLSPKKSIFDKNSMGSFHQKVGEFLAARRVTNKWKWWNDQKFNSEGTEVSDSIYKRIQLNHLINHLKSTNYTEKKVLDFGCGNGYFSYLFAQEGAHVIGIDTNTDLIDLANKNFSAQHTTFMLSKENNQSVLFLKECINHFDVIFSQDVLSIILNHTDLTNNILTEDVYNLLKSLVASLKTGGTLICMDPNPIFWLAGRYGSSSAPIAVLTEYQHKFFSTSPNNNTLVNLLGELGLGLIFHEHPRALDNDDPNNVYNNHFCIWDFMIFKKIQ